MNSYLLASDIYKAPLSVSIAKEYNKLIQIISMIPLELQVPKAIDFTGGKVSISDALAYQIGWGNLLIGWYTAGIQNQIPQMPGEGFSTWDYVGLAQHFYTAYGSKDLAEQLQIFKEVVQRILEIVEKEYQTGNLDKTRIWQWCTLPSGKEWPLSKWVTVNTVAPYKRASAATRAFLKPCQ